MGIFARIMVGLTPEVPDNKTFLIDANYLKDDEISMLKVRFAAVESRHIHDE